ncbi:uncharacterized protein LOC114228041 [Eptesicus fuscus]|uniref:uncharacterized protein LOC114228041 n=1 Tax=Eptesicus fuscus TaxID=29078 RepID=UPI0024041893|nr:uncharacterized protein LOC114228041 [Eptesicus fuscus]
MDFHSNERAKLNSREDAVVLTQHQKAGKASSSQSISSQDKGNDAGRCVSQDNVPQPELPVEAAACSQAAGEKAAFSEHLIGVSTPSKRPRLDEDEIKELPVSQHSEQTEDSSDYLQTYIPSHALNKNEPFQSPVHGTDVRPMKMYYMRVQLERGHHSPVVDKPVLLPPRLGLPYNLMADHLRCSIQGGVDVHSASEDASACRHLVIWKIGQDAKTKR